MNAWHISEQDAREHVRLLRDLAKQAQLHVIFGEGTAVSCDELTALAEHFERAIQPTEDNVRVLHQVDSGEEPAA